MSLEAHTESVSNHYHSDDIATTLLDALACAGKSPANLTIDDLAPADEIHTRGREATVELAQWAGLPSGLDIVDVGSGIGGPARFLASHYNARVTGIDLTPGFCHAATRLTQALGLDGQVRFHCASALNMPLDDGAFDLAWTIQMQMNIADKPALYKEIHRVLKRGGRFVFQDIALGPRGELHLPVPWASAPEHSHLLYPEDLRRVIADAGFEEVSWRDVSEAHRDWTSRQAAARADGQPPSRPPVGIHMVLGPDAFQKRKNAGRCLMEHRIGFVQGVFRKPA